MERRKFQITLSIVRNQIDYILINSRYRNAFTSIKTYPGADIQLDHNPVVGVFKLRLKKVHKRIVGRYNLQKLKNPAVAIQVRKKLNEHHKNNKRLAHKNVSEEMQELCESVQTLKTTLLQPEKLKRKLWMTSEIFEMMEQRRNNKNKPVLHKELDNSIRIKIREAKQRELELKCKEIEPFSAKYVLIYTAKSRN